LLAFLSRQVTYEKEKEQEEDEEKEEP